MTAAKLIHRALRLLGVIDATEAPEADQAEDALEALNGMLAEWRGADILVPDYDVADLSDELTLDRADLDAVIYKLADRIGPEYGRSLPADARAVMDESFSRLRLRYFQPGTVDFCELPVATSRGQYRI